MDTHIKVEPLPHRKRQNAFIFLVLIFLVSLPFLYMYATGYRFDVEKPNALVSTGGLYIGVDRTGAEIFIDDELMRETRTFRKAFYAQGLDAGTHRVHVQKEGYHTWVKELSVSKHRVTVAEAFSMPVVPQVRVISEWQTATGSAVIQAPLLGASSTNQVVATSTTKHSAFILNDEFKLRAASFATTSTSTLQKSKAVQVISNMVSSTTVPVNTATTTIVSGGVKLFESEGDVFATWVGSFEQMPYYFCAEEFPRYTGTSSLVVEEDLLEEDLDVENFVEDNAVMHPIQNVSKDIPCDPTIRIDRKGKEVRDFDFFPGSTDLVLMVLEDGVYVVEVDDRAWQNVQPLFMGNNIQMMIENGSIYVYDGVLIYQIMLTLE